jgi:hypothetical protein
VSAPRSSQVHRKRIQFSEIRVQEIWIERTDLFEALNEMRQIAAGPSETAPE